MAQAFVVGVTTEIPVMGERARSLWAVLTETPEQAVEAVRRSVSPSCEVDDVIGALTGETVERLGLELGKAKHL
jgi:hypothetical protein